MALTTETPLDLLNAIVTRAKALATDYNSYSGTTSGTFPESELEVIRMKNRWAELEFVRTLGGYALRVNDNDFYSDATRSSLNNGNNKFWPNGIKKLEYLGPNQMRGSVMATAIIGN